MNFETGERVLRLMDRTMADLDSMADFDHACSDDQEGIGQDLQLLLARASDLYEKVFALDRAHRTPHPATDAFGFETDNVIMRRPCGRCHGLTEKEDVRGTLGDFGVICERCMDELGLIDEYNFVKLSFDLASMLQGALTHSEDEYEALAIDTFADLQRRYRDGERVTAVENRNGSLSVEVD